MWQTFKILHPAQASRSCWVEAFYRKLITKPQVSVTMALEDIDPDIVGMLLPGEQVIFIASQSKVAPRLALQTASISRTCASFSKTRARAQDQHSGH